MVYCKTATLTEVMHSVAERRVVAEGMAKMLKKETQQWGQSADDGNVIGRSGKTSRNSRGGDDGTPYIII